MSRLLDSFRLSGPSAFPWVRRSLFLTLTLCGVGLPIYIGRERLTEELEWEKVEFRTLVEQRRAIVQEFMEVARVALANQALQPNVNSDIRTNEEILENDIVQRLREIVGDFKASDPKIPANDLQKASNEILTYVDLIPRDRFTHSFLNSELLSAVPYEPLHLDLLAIYLNYLQIQISEGEILLPTLEDERGDQDSIIFYLSMFYKHGATEKVRSLAKQAMEHYLAEPRSIWIFSSLLMHSNNTPEFQNALLERMLLEHIFSFSYPEDFKQLTEEGQGIVLGRYLKWMDDLLAGSTSAFSFSGHYWKQEDIDCMEKEIKGKAKRMLSQIRARLPKVEEFIQENTPKSESCSCECKDSHKKHPSKKSSNFLMP